MNSEDKIKILKRYLNLASEIDTLIETCSFENEKRIAKIKEYRSLIRIAIMQVKDDKQRVVLEQIYLLGRTRELVAERLSYSVTQINRYHKDAIKHINLDNVYKINL